VSVAKPLPEALLHAVQALQFSQAPDRWQAGAPLGHMPSIDLAVAAFAPGRPARWANVLFSREHPQGHVARIGADAGPLQGLRFDADRTNAAGDSDAWLPGADWDALHFQPLYGSGPLRFVAPYPASLLKLMVAVGVGLALDAGELPGWPADLEPMVTVSSNEATDRCVALLHRTGWLPQRLNDTFAACGLPTLQLHRTTPAGGWRNADGSGVGHIHMTAWDTVRLLWLLDAAAPPPPWLPAGTPPLLQAATRAHLRALLQRQQLDEVLSSGRLRGEPGWVEGLPDAPAFAHKTGTTDNYASDAGILHTPQVHCIVAVLTSLGRRYAATPACASTWRLPALGAAVHRVAVDLCA
jgi:hypothetical protein